MTDGGERGEPPRLDRERIHEAVAEAFREARERAGAGGGELRPAYAGAAPGPGWRARWLTFPRVSLALNAVLIAVLLMAFGPDRFSRGTLSIQVDDTVVRVFEPDEPKPVWGHDFGVPVFRAAVAPWSGDGWWDRRVRFAVASAWKQGHPRPSLTVWDVWKDELAWAHDFPDEEMYAHFRGDRLSEGRMWCRSFVFADLHGDGEPELVGNFHHDVMSPACIRTFDKHGNVIGSYYHRGYFYDLAAADLDGDGRDEVVAAGTNNVTNSGTVVLLDAEHLSGFGTADEAPWGGREEGALVRMVLPRWPDPVMEYLGDRVRNHARWIDVRPEADPPTISVKVGQGKEPEYVVVLLEADLHPRRTVLPDDLRQRLTRGREEGALDLPVDEYGWWDRWAAAARFYRGRAGGEAGDPL